MFLVNLCTQFVAVTADKIVCGIMKRAVRTEKSAGISLNFLLIIYLHAIFIAIVLSFWFYQVGCAILGAVTKVRVKSRVWRKYETIAFRVA